MYYLHHVHAASACAQTVYLSNFLPSGPCLCRVLHTSLSFISLPNSIPSSTSTTSTPLSEVLSAPLNARIIRVIAIPSNEEGAMDRIAVLTDHHQPRLIILRYGSANAERERQGALVEGSDEWTPIETEAVLLLDEMGRPAAESGLTLETEGGLDPDYLISHTHAGILKVVPLSQSSKGANGRIMEVDSKEINFTGAFGVRLPHPHLISSTFLAKTSPNMPSTLALLSLSSVASRIPGLGMQCLPVLSFHSIDEADQELKPVGWGPPRRSPSQTTPTSPKASRRKSSVSQQATSEKQAMPGAFRPSSQGQIASGTRQASTSGGKSSNGPAAMGANKAEDEDRLKEEALVKSPLTRAHVPIPFVDALGVHLLLSLPASIGGGVLLFGETCVFHIASPYSTGNTELRSPLGTTKSSLSPSAPGKRRKASISQQASQPRQMSGSSSAISITELSSTTSTSAIPSNRSNENGKRRRSTAGSQAGPSSPIKDTLSTSPTSSRKMKTGSSPSATRILRLEHTDPIIVASAVVLIDPSNPQDDGVTINTSDASQATLRVLFGTHSGLLYLLTISLEKNDGDVSQVFRPFDMYSLLIGTIPAPGGPNALTYLGEDFVSISSAGGDSIVVQIVESELIDSQGDIEMANSRDIHLRTVYRWSNLAPILDFVVDDGAGGDPSHAKSAQARIITASGSGPTGSLRIIRNGVSLEDIFRIEEANVRRFWSIESSSQGETHLILLAYHTSTRVLRINSEVNGGFEDVTELFEQAGLQIDKPLLAAESLQGDAFVTINEDEVSIWAIAKLECMVKLPLVKFEVEGIGNIISKATANKGGQVLIAARTHIVLLKVQSDFTISIVGTKDLQSEVSAFDISPINGSNKAELIAVALWNPQVVKMIHLSTWEDVTPSALAIPQPNLIRSIMLHTFSINNAPTSEPYLLLGLGDGSLNSYGLSLPTADSLSKRIGILEKRSASMGNQPLHLRSFKTSKGLQAVFVNCDRPSVIFSHGKGLQYSTVRHREVNDICQFFLQDETMMIFAKMDQLIISKMSAIQKLDIATQEMCNDNPIALAMAAKARSLAVVSNSFFPLGRTKPAMEGGKIILFDYEDFERLDEYGLEQEERANCIEYVELNGRSTFVVGTGFTFIDRSETLNGRVLVFDVDGKSRKLRLMASINVDGNTYAVGSINNRIIACVNSKVLAFDVEEELSNIASPLQKKKTSNTVQSCDLMQVGEWACAFTAVTLRTIGSSRMLIGDALRSLVLLKVDQDTGRIIELARDCDPYWTISAEMLDEEKDLYIGSDIAFNIWTCSRVKWTEEAKENIIKHKNRNEENGNVEFNGNIQQDLTWSHIMKRQGAYHYGDLINTMKRGSLTAKKGNSNTADGVESKVIFATAAGAIGVIAELQGRTSTILSQLDMSLKESIEPIGRISAEDWRTLRTDHRMQKNAGFIDGDFLVSTYEHLSNEKRAKLTNQGPLRIDAEAGEVNSLIESLNRLS